MILTDLLSELKRKNIYLYLDNGALRGKFPPNTNTPELKTALQNHKAEIIEYLRQTQFDEGYAVIPINRENGLLLSYSQERLWFLDQFEGGSASYNLPGAVRLTGELDRSVLRRSLNEIIRRHEVLRTNFVMEEGRAVQIIATELELAIDVTDLSSLPEELRESKIQRHLTEEAQKPFDLAHGPLVRASLLALGSSQSSGMTVHVLLFTLHHIVSDGWSTAILIREFIALYEAYRKDQTSPLAELPIQYADYAIWQRNWLQGERLEQQVNYWKQQLAGAAAVLELPADRPRPVVQSYRGATLYTTVPQAVTEQLKLLGRQQDATLFMVLLAAFNILLSRYSGQEDLCVGTPVANRNRLEIEGLIGFFINTLVLRTDLSGNPSFTALLQRVREVCLGAQTHQDLPFEKLVEELAPVRDMSHHPLFQVMLALQNTPETALEIEGLRITPEFMETGAAKFDLDLEISEGKDGLAVQFSYNTDLFDSSTIARMAEHYGVLLAHIAEAPDQLLSELQLLTPPERNRLLLEWNDTEVDYPRGKCIHQLFEEQVDINPNAVAVVFEGEQLTYGQLNEKANRLAHYLRTQGIGAEMLVGICVERSLEMIVAVLGILKAGAAYLPIDPELPTERLRQILQDANTRWILTLSELVGKIPEFCSIACLDHSLESGKQLDEDLPDLIFDERQLAYMLYTSGTTGLPKGVGVNHSNLVNQYFAWEMAYGLRDNYVHLQMARYTFDVFAGDWIRALCSGGKLVICSKETLLQPVQLYALMQREQVTVAEFVPAVLRLLMEYLEETGQRLAFMELLICGSDRWYAGEYKKFLKLCGQKTRLINSYGLTEATIDSTYFETQQVNSLTQELVPLGQGFANTCAYILDRWLNPAPIGVPGELYIGGAGVVRGYFNRPELTGERFIPNPFSQKPGERLYKTGDVVSYLPDGNIEHLGRTDHQVKIRGFRIELGEIETTLLQHPAISAAIVVARDESTPGSQRLVAYVVGNDVEPDIDDLRMYLKACLPDYMVPTAFVVLDCLPVNANGKVDREALPAPEVDDRFVHQYVAPRTQTEKIIAAIWAEVLGLERVGMHDNFFQLGGHSLLAMILIERVRRQGLHADVRSLFITQTLAEFVSVLDSNNRVVEVPDNRIPGSCEHITPEMLPLVALKQTEIDSVMQQVPGGARNVQDIYALTPFQEGILFHHLISTDGDPYLLSSLLAFDTRNRLDCFLNALQAVVDRHDILRTAVMWEELSVPVQVVLREVALSVTEITLNPAFGDAAKQLQERFDPRHFRLDIRQAPLIQGYVAWDAQQDRWLLLILEHHLALDHVAMEAVLKEVRAYLLDQFDQLLPSLPFRNFVAQTRMGMKPEEHEAFFRKLLGNVDEPTAPFGLLDVQGDGSDIVEAIIDLDDALDQRIRVCAQSIGVSAASVFHLAWAQVLALISGKETVVFGTVLFGRTQSGDEAADRMLGMFINTLPVCFDVTETGCKIGIQKMHRLLAELMRHEHASLALAQRCSAVPSPAPLFSTLLNYRHSVNEGSVAADVSASWWESMGIKVLKEDERTNYPFTLSIDDFGNSFRLTMQVQSPIEPQRMIRYLQTALTGLVDALTSNPGKAICTIDVLPESEREQIISEWNKIKASCLQDERIHELFERQAKHQPQAIAVTYEDKQLTYGELNARANRIAHGLRARGVGSEVLVGLFFERSLEMVIGILGVLKAGGAYLPIDPNYPQERIAFMIEDAKPKVILTQSALMEGIPHEIATFCLDQDLSDQSDYSWDNPVSMGTANNLAYVIYTSGSTGKPKGVMVTHFNVRRLFAITEQDYGFSNADIWTLFHSYAFDFSVWEIWGALLYGGRLIVVPDSVRHSPDALHQLLQEQRVTVLNQTPTSFYQLDNVDKQALKNDSLALRLIIFGGEALEFGQLRGWFERHGDARPQLVNMYGITETTVHVTWASLKQSDAERSGNSSVGRPLPDLQAFILDKQGNLAPMGVQGELYIGGFGLARGYLNRADLTAERFVPHPFDDREGERLYRTGDLARYRESGDIEYLGRIDQQVKIRGFRIELGEIESVLAQHPLINEVVVVARTDVPGEKRLVAYVAIDQSENAVVNTDDLRAYLQARLPDYMVPAAWVFLDSLPLTMNGKVDRKALPAPDIETQIASRYLAPRNTTEEILANIWAKVLRLEKIGIDDNFFALGGDSIRSIQVVGLAKERELTVPMEQLYKYGTIRSLAQTLMAADFSTIEAVSLDPFALLTVEDLSKLPPGIQDAYPLTEMQAGMIFHSEQELGAYHVVDSIKVQCTLNAEVLRAALAQVFARHPVLRTSFDLGSFSEPLQLVHQQCDVPLAVYDLAHFSSPEQEEVLANYLQLVRGDHFDVSKLPLIRFSAHYLAEDKLQLTIVGHHAIIDGWSLISLLIEIFQRCLAIQQSQSFPEKHLPNAMRNLVVRERKALNSAVDRGFWKQWLSSATINSFPYLASMSGAISAHKNDWPEVDLHLPLNISEQLKQLAQSLAVPLKCVLLAAHLRILSLLYGERNVTTGLVASTRPEGLDGDQVLGVFLNTLPLRMQLQGGTWAELITQVFAAEREMLNSRYYPLAGLHRLQGNTEFFDTTFNYLHYHVGEDFLNSDHAKIIAWSNPIRPNFALEVTFNWDVITHQIQLTLQGDSTRLDQVQLERISQYYMDALSAIADDSSVRYDTDSLLGTAEWHQVLVEWNDTEVDYPRDKCIHELFEEQVEKRPEAVAVIFEGKQLTYSQLNKKANQLAHYLSTQGVGPETLVGICVERSLEMIVGILGILKAGSAYLPIDPGYPKERIAFMMEDAHPTVILIHEPTRGIVPDGLKIIDLVSEDNMIVQFSEENPAGSTHTQNLAYVIYTSGSTGKPKGSSLAHQGVVNRLVWMQQQYQLNEKDRVLQKTPFSFDVSVWEFFWPLITGARLVVLSPGAHKDSARITELIEQEQISTLHFVPSMLSVFLETAESLLCPSLRQVFCSGEALPANLQKQFFEKIPTARLHNLYGPTEASVDVTYWACIPNSNDTTVPIGRPIANTRIYLLDAHLNPVPVGVAGELYIGGVGLARGYLNQADLTADRFVPDTFDTTGGRLYRTGDLARYRADGNIEYIGRTDYQVKIRGFRIELGEIETILAQHREIHEAVVVAREDSSGNKRLVAYVVGNEASLSSDELKIYLKAHLPDYMVPAALVFLDCLPLSTNGKLDRKALPEPDIATELVSQYVAPRNSIEEALAKLWAEVLGLEQVGIHDDFFELGGHSLLATQVMARIRLAFDIDLPLSVLLRTPTIAEMSPAVEEAIFDSIQGLSESEAECLLQVERD